MRDPWAFLKIKRRPSTYRPVKERIKDYREVGVPRSDEETVEQASRCMSCGLPFCHWICPAGNYVPEWNDFLARGKWKEAYESLQTTNNFPEWTGRLCPASCEYACVLAIDEDATTIRDNELSIIEHAFKAGFVEPHPPAKRTGKSVAVIGSGPSGLACADQLNKAGHRVVVFERDDRIGGILRYGIPDFKLEKWVIDRRLEMLQAEGIEFKTGVYVGVDYPASRLLQEFDAICLAGGSRVPRDLKVEGRELQGIHFAMAYLVQSNRRVAGEKIPPGKGIDAKGKKVVVIGGGDTGADCVGTAHRQGASRVVQIELLPKPPESRKPEDLWPNYPLILRNSSSHEEGGERRWSVLTKKFSGENGFVKKLSCVAVNVTTSEKTGFQIQEIPGTGFELEADLVLLAMGFVSAEPHGLLKELGTELDGRGNVKTGQDQMTSAKGIFSAGDMRRGQSLVIWAISEGRKAAHHIDRYLMGDSKLPLMT